MIPYRGMCKHADIKLMILFVINDCSSFLRIFRYEIFMNQTRTSNLIDTMQSKLQNAENSLGKNLRMYLLFLQVNQYCYA